MESIDEFYPYVHLMGISFIFMFGCVCKGRWNIFTCTMQVTHYYYYYYCVNMKEKIRPKKISGLYGI